MSPWSCPSTSSLVVAALVAALAACSDDGGPACGPGDAPAAGLTLTIAGEAVTYGGFTAGVNNDCTDFSSGVISVTIHATQVGGTGTLTLCVPRPDLITGEPVTVTASQNPPGPTERLQLVDASATLASGCTVARDPQVAPAATGTFTGYCDGGADPAGYALALAGTAGLRRTCPAGMDAVTGTFAGAAAVALAD